MAAHGGRHCFERDFLKRKLELEFVGQTFADGADGALDAAIADPGTFLVRLDHAGVLQNLHVVRNGWLGEFDSLFNVGGGPAFGDASLARRAGMQQAEDLAPGWIGDGAERQAQLIGSSFHDGSLIIKHS